MEIILRRIKNMPSYKSVDELPTYVKDYSPKLQRQFIHVFNTVFEKVLKETKNSKDAESRSMMAANSILKKRFSMGQNINNETHADYFEHLMDKFLGNLQG